MSRVLVVGTPRSGTTWIGQALGRSRATVYVHEPDGPNDAFALRAKRGHGIQNEIAPGTSAPDYERLWSAAFAGGEFDRSPRGRVAKYLVDSTSIGTRMAALRGEQVSLRARGAMALATPLRPRPSENVVVKSVHACLAVEWIAEKFEPRVVVVRRSPLNVLSSWKTLGHGGDPKLVAQLADVAWRRWKVRVPPDDADLIVRRATVLGVLTGALADGCARHPEWTAVRHDDVSAEPVDRLGSLAHTVGLDFSDDAESYVRQSNQPGAGYATKRVAGTATDKWRTVLSDSEADESLTTLALFPAELRLLD
jgi:hypothetical protein